MKNYLRQPLYTYEFKKVSELMIEMRKAMINIVIVLDEYGATAGTYHAGGHAEEIVGETVMSTMKMRKRRLSRLAPGNMWWKAP